MDPEAYLCSSCLSTPSKRNNQNSRALLQLGGILLFTSGIDQLFCEFKNVFLVAINLILQTLEETGPLWWSSGQRAHLLSNYPSWNPTEAYNFFCNIVFEKNVNKQKRGRRWATLKNIGGITVLHSDPLS